MIHNKKVLAIIPARGGSKGIVRKNLTELEKHPLIAFAIASAHCVQGFDRIMVSTEDSEIAETAIRYGATVPFLRPNELAQDETPMIDVVIHIISSLEKMGEHYDYICLLQPTSPFRNPESIKLGIHTLAQNPSSDSCVAITPVVDSHPKRLRKLENGYIVGYLDRWADNERQQRQAHNDDLAFRRCGTFYITRTDAILSKHSLYGEKTLPVIVEGPQAVTIDDSLDLLLAKSIWGKKAEFKELDAISVELDKYC